MRWVETVLIALLAMSACVENSSENTLQGPFENVAGTLDPLTCICPNAGYVTVEGQRIPLCFQPRRIVDCTDINAKAEPVTKQVVPPINKTWCVAEEAQYYLVKRFECT